VVVAGGWLVGPGRADLLASAIADAVAAHDREHPLDRGLAPSVLADRLGLPTPELVGALVRPPLRVAGGRVRGTEDDLPATLVRALEELAADLAEHPFVAPTADRLRVLGLDRRSLAAAARAGRLLRLDESVVLLPGADTDAVRLLADLPQPFTASQARELLGTSRRVVLPLLDHLDRRGLTRRLPDDRRLLADG
jgi:selenocysteine-specific elongation factor